MAKTISVHVIETVLITPSEPTPNHVLQLSPLDSQCDTGQVFMVFNGPRPGVDRAAMTSNVKSSLARVLVPYYPLAGRVRHRADHESSLEVVCGAQGALFVEAVSDSTVSEFDQAPEHEAKWREFFPMDEINILKGDPLLAMKLTWLSDGGAVLVVGSNHCMFDGNGCGQFLRSFTEIALGRRGPSELEPKPTWSRHLMNRTPTTLRTDLMNRHPLTMVSDFVASTSRYADERLTPSSTTFDVSWLRDSKKVVGHGKCSSLDVLAAHLWRRWVRELNFQLDKTVKLVFAVDIRKRVEPSLPDGYYGNAYVLVGAQTCVRDLIGKDLGYAAELVAKAKERVDEEYVREAVQLVGTGRTRVDMDGTFFISDWTKAGFDRVEFGMGKPAQVWPVRWDVCILLPLANSMNSIKVNMGVSSTGGARDVGLVIMRQFEAYTIDLMECVIGYNGCIRTCKDLVSAHPRIRAIQKAIRRAVDSIQTLESVDVPSASHCGPESHNVVGEAVVSEDVAELAANAEGGTTVSELDSGYNNMVPH